MATSAREFVAEDLWLLIAILTFGIVTLALFAGLEGLAMTLVAVGWFLLTPIFLFWGEEIAAWLLEEDGDEVEPTADDPETDALEELKRRYASGEIDDEEFERKLERLLAVDELPGELLEAGSNRDDADRERELER